MYSPCNIIHIYIYVYEYMCFVCVYNIYICICICVCTGCRTEYVDLKRFIILIPTMILKPFL